MLIVIEGVDGSGKSTLASDLSEIIGYENKVTSLHRGVPIDHMLVEYETALMPYYPMTGDSVICDRWHIGPDVYGPIKRGDQGLDPVIKWHIENYLAAKGALIVYTEMALDGLLDRLNTRGEDYLSLDEVGPVVDLYREVIEKTTLPVYKSTTGIHSALDVIARARREEEGARQSGAIHSYVGPRRPQELYVGDSSTEVAYMPFEGSEAYEIVNKYGVNNNFRAGFVNCTEDMARVWDALYNPLVIAIDGYGIEECMRAHIPFTTLEDTWNN